MECLVHSLPVCSTHHRSWCVVGWVNMRGCRWRERGRSTRTRGVRRHRSKSGDTNHKVCLPDLYIYAAMTGDDSSCILTAICICQTVRYNHLLLVKYGSDDSFSFPISTLERCKLQSSILQIAGACITTFGVFHVSVQALPWTGKFHSVIGRRPPKSSEQM